MRLELVFLLLLPLCGCAGSNIARPKIPDLLGGSSPVVLYKTQEFNSDYSAYRAAVSPRAAKILRDQIINRIRMNIDLNFREYESQLFFGRAGTNVGLDVLEMGLSTGATLAGAEYTKTVLAAILTGTKGSRLSFDKNFFAERTTSIIISRMETLRGSLINDLSRKMTLTVAEYPLEESWVDLVNLFYAGTLAAGVQALASDAGQANAEMKTQNNVDLERRLLKNP